jgi:hypothetical protein
VLYEKAIFFVKFFDLWMCFIVGGNCKIAFLFSGAIPFLDCSPGAAPFFCLHFLDEARRVSGWSGHTRPTIVTGNSPRNL